MIKAIETLIGIVVTLIGIVIVGYIGYFLWKMMNDPNFFL